MIPEYRLIRSRRRSISLSVKTDGVVEVRAPLSASRKSIDDFVTVKSKWIASVKERNSNSVILKETDKYDTRELIRLTSERVKNYLDGFSGKHPSKITVRRRKSVWGTCNAKGAISINSFVGLLPDDLFEYIIIHELMHLEVLHHNRYFWNLVSYYIPDWKSRRAKLRRYHIEF